MLHFSSKPNADGRVILDHCVHMDHVKRIWYLSPMRAAKVQASLRIRAVSPEPSLLAHTSSESRGTFRQKARSLAPLKAGHVQLKFVMMECSKTQIRLTGLICPMVHLQQLYSSIMMVSHCNSLIVLPLSSIMHQPPDMTPYPYIILTLSRPVLALPVSGPSPKWGSASNRFFNDLLHLKCGKLTLLLLLFLLALFESPVIIIKPLRLRTRMTVTIFRLTAVNNIA